MASLNIDAVSEFRSDDQGNIFKVNFAARKTGCRPFVPLFDLVNPAAFIPAYPPIVVTSSRCEHVSFHGKTFPLRNSFVAE
jgi:hypothetical protein